MIKIIFLLFFTLNAYSESLKSNGIYTTSKEDNNKIKAIKAQPLAYDSRFKVFTFVENGVYEIIALYDNTTYIEFESDEMITSLINPKDSFWQFLPQQNRLFFKPIASDGDTQITVITNKRTYFFEMHAMEPDESSVEDHTFYYQFRYLSEDEQKTIRRYAKSLLPNIELEPEKYNFNYTITGHNSIFPIKIFDDGEFTYFEFRDKGGVLPAIFVVDSDNNESIVNFRMVGSYLVVETVSPKFTLRNGSDIVCVFNETLYTKPKPVKKGFTGLFKK